MTPRQLAWCKRSAEDGEMIVQLDPWARYAGSKQALRHLSSAVVRRLSAECSQLPAPGSRAPSASAPGSYPARLGFKSLAIHDSNEVWPNGKARGLGPRDCTFESCHLDEDTRAPRALPAPSRDGADEQR